MVGSPRQCARHPRRLSVARCVRCSIPVCDACRTIVKGRDFCPGCVAFAAALNRKGRHRPWVACVLSLIVPGMGQVYNGQMDKGVWILATSWLVVPWILGVVDAGVTARGIRSGRIPPPASYMAVPGCLVALLLLAAVPVLWLRALHSYRHRHGIEPRREAASRRLRWMAEAAEAYAEKHGVYPSRQGEIGPEGRTDLCGVAFGGYRYVCRLTKGGYVMRAEPVDQTSGLGPPLEVVTGVRFRK